MAKTKIDWKIFLFAGVFLIFVSFTYFLGLHVSKDMISAKPVIITTVSLGIILIIVSSIKYKKQNQDGEDQA